jgi:DNA-binding NarL/FixJ family response regulator
MSLARVVVIEDDPFTRTMLTAALEAGDIRVSASGSLARVAMEAQVKEQIDVAILDLDLGVGPTGIDIAYALREVDSAIGIVLLTSFSDPRLSPAQGIALPRGTRYLTKSKIDNMAIVLTVVLQAKFSPLEVHVQSSPETLAITGQQVAALKLVAGGATNSEIARQLDITEKAVEHLIARLNENLGLDKSSSTNSRVQLVRKFSDLTGGQLP